MGTGKSDKPVIGMDLGGTKILAGVVSLEGKVLGTAKRATKAAAGPDAAERIDKKSAEQLTYGAMACRYTDSFRDASDTLAESNEEDNAIFRSIVVSDPGAGLANLYLDYLTHEEGLRAGQPFVIETGIAADPWDVGLPLYTVRVLIDDVVVCSMDIDSSSIGVLCDVPGLTAGIHQLAVLIDADNDLAESDETDNDRYGQFSVQG